MEFHGNFSIDFHGKYLHGGLVEFMEFTGIRHLKYPVNQIEYITDFGTHCNLFNP